MFKPNSRHYTVGEYTTHDKLQAMMYSESTGHHIHYHIPNFLLEHDLSIEPVDDMWTLCTKHAQHIRNTYDTVRIFYSGGCDSHYMLRVFVENNIHIDEIVMANCGIPGTDFEIDDVAVPYLESIRQHIPDTVVKVYTKNIQDYYNFYAVENWWEQYFVDGRCCAQACVFLRLNNVLESMNLYPAKGRTASLYGEGKPLLFYKNNNWYTYFQDNEEYMPGTVDNDFVGFYNDDVDVYTKQCHLLKRGIENSGYDYNAAKHQSNYDVICAESLCRVDVGEYFIPYQHTPYHPDFHSINGREMIAKQYMIQNHPQVWKDYCRGLDKMKTLSTKWWTDNNPEKGHIKCLSKILGITTPGVYSVDELFPNGFNL